MVGRGKEVTRSGIEEGAHAGGHTCGNGMAVQKEEVAQGGILMMTVAAATTGREKEVVGVGGQGPRKKDFC